MNSKNTRAWRHLILIGVMTVIVALGMSATALADLRIVTQTEVSMPGVPTLPGMGSTGSADVQELFIKNNRIALPEADGTRFVIDCASGTFAIVADGAQAYWQGTIADFQGELQAAFEMMGISDPDGGPGWIEELFGSGKEANAVPVRTTRVGTETVAGYEAVQYRVEYEQNGAWHLFANVSAAPALLQQIEAEVGSCFNTFLREMQLTFLGMELQEADETWAVLTSPEYAALAAEGFAVRNEQTVETFGMRVETTTTVTEVSRGGLADDLFAIPEHYETITLLEAMMPSP